MLGSQRPPEDVVSASAHMAAEPAEPGNEQKPTKRVTVTVCMSKDLHRN